VVPSRPPPGPSGPFDGQWKGTGFMGTACFSHSVDVVLTIVGNKVSGKIVSMVGTSPVSGEIRDDGSLMGRFGAGVIEGKFEGGLFRGTSFPSGADTTAYSAASEVVGSGCQAEIILERIKPQPPASTDASTSVTPTGPTSSAPSRAPQQLAVIPPNSSNPVTNSAKPRARYDGEWKGRTIGQTGCNSLIRVKVANNTMSGQMTLGTYGGNTEVSGTISDDGSFAGTIADATLSGKFEEDRFEGVLSDPTAKNISSAVTGMGSAGQYCSNMLVILARVK
jgi:hypothetical protein